ncbi:hypothetical protein RM545_17445 [Zunongwangia sp. F260]|uniref:Uncharacterized protein n=1 Tax=Autumnicola lenta TaxID=3075593 RepID=A0ABU3CQ77_9FLAO|nr:hypothetical protein [Zunongwangia sp. F260]MDT0648476.1 hypothetical protein [Zunongwangia sp. F260]
MNAFTKRFLLLMFIPFVGFSQTEYKSSYPKDTIYIQYKPATGPKKWNAKFRRDYNGVPGVYFNVEQKKGDMALFYADSLLTDTLPLIYLNEYQFSDLEQIKKKKRNWIEKKFNGLEYKPYGGSKNGVFQTYLIEVISDKAFVKYPVHWRNEGAID